MKPKFSHLSGFSSVIRTALLFTSSLLPLAAVPIAWDNSNATGAWSTPANWDTNTEPTAADDLTFPLSLAGPLTLTTTENAKSLQFDGGYTLSGGTLALASGNSIGVADGVTATINNALSITGGLSKTGNGTLVLGGSNTNPGGTVISAGRIRAASTGAMGAAGVVTTVNANTTLEIGGIALDRPTTLMNGGRLLGTGTATSNGVTTIDGAATSVTLGTESLSDVLILSTAANELTGGTGSTVINIGGPGGVRLNLASNFPGSWNIPSGRLELVANGALGSGSTSVTLSGGALVGRSSTALVVTGPGSNLLLTANSSILSDRTAASAGAGVNHTFGTLSMGTHTLTVAPGVNPNSGTASITLGNVTLTGNPLLAVDDNGVVNGKLTTGSLLGGGIARTLTKTGAGDLAVTGGATDLIASSAFSASGGGTIVMLFPDLGAGSPLAITAAQNPFGAASISVTDGALRLLANGSNTSAIQTFQLPSAITLGGMITLDPDERSGSNSNKTFELPGLTLASGTELSMSGDNLYGVRLTGPLVLQGNATLKGIDTTSKDGLLTLDGGISGGPTTALAIGGGTSPLNLTINSSSTYGGGTAMSGGNVTLNAVNALGTGPLTQSGGSLIVNTDNALVGTLNLNGGTLRVNDTNALASNPISLNGGTLDFRNNTNATISTGTLTVRGTSGISIGGSGSGIFDFPQLNVAEDTTLTVTPVSTSFVPNFQNIALAGNLKINNTNTARIQTITETGSPRTLIKTGIGTLELEGVGSHSGGTEVIAGILLVENAGALGSGDLTLGDATVANTNNATVQVNSSLTIVNDLVVRSGSSGTLTFDAPAGGVTWNGDLALQRTVTLDNGSASVLSSFNGVLSGTGDLVKVSAGEIVLGNAANSFTGTIAINDGTLSVASNGALGALGNGVTLAGDAVLKIDSTFSSSRTITSNGTTNSVSVSGVNEFTVNSALAGAGTFLKSGTGILTLAPGVDSSARSGAISGVTGGTLRVQGVKNLSDTGIITLNGSAGTIEFLRDANTVFPHPVTADGTGTLHVDRAIGGTGTNGRHTLGTLGMASGTLTVTGANGYGLSLGAATVTSNNTITNNAPGTLRIASFTGNPGNSNLFVTFAGSGDIEITGALTEGAGAGNYGIGKNGPGTLRFGSSVTEFGRFATIQDGTLDLNGLTYPVSALTFGGLASVSGATIVTGASGSLVLAGDVLFDAITTGQAGALFSGNLGLGAASRNFNIENNASAAADLTIDGPISGTAGAAIVKSGAGTLLLTGAGNTQPGLFSSSAGVVELAKSSGDAIGSGGLSITGGTVRLAAGEQIHNAAAVSLSSANETFLELANFTETVGPLSLTQTDYFDYTAVKTGATGTLVLNGNLTLNNNTSFPNARNVLITGTGGETTPVLDGTLDLGGATRTIHVTTTIIDANQLNANATIETRIINGGILKTGPRILYLTNPNNTFNGGLQIAQGFVRPGTGTSLGLAPVTFTNPPGVSAGIDFGTLTGTLAAEITTGSGGEAAFIYSGSTSSTLTLSGGFGIAQELVFNVVNGTVIKGNSAVLDVTGVIDDAAGTFGLRKRGNGTLKLAAGNTYGGSTVVEKGILAIPANSALGNSTAPLTLDGGCLANSASFILTRDLTITPNGGNIRSNEIPQTLEISGALTWSDGTTTIDGSGRTVISGTTTSGPVANLVLGSPIAFATGTADFNSWNSRVCLQGSAALPGGNLSITNFAVLELGNGNFTRALGTGPGEVQLPTSQGGGWAAVGANRSVNIGGGGASLLWGQTSPTPFLYNSGGVGSLVLGSISATHTVEFQNPLDFNNAASSVSRSIITHEGAATVDARITGDLGLSSSTNEVYLDLTSYGTLEITGDILGPVSLNHYGAGRTILSGNNDLTASIYLGEGTLEFANDASFGSPNYISISSGATLDATAMTVPVAITPNGFYDSIEVNGVLDGNVQVIGALSGSGEITGNVEVENYSVVSPDIGGTLRIGGDLTMNPVANLYFDIQTNNTVLEYAQLQVEGGVNLDGPLPVDLFNLNLPPGFTGTLPLILNGGSDLINGTFNDTFIDFTEGLIIEFNGIRLQITYVANGDGGPVANDFAVIVLGPDGGSSFENWIGTFPSLTNPADKTKAANPDNDTLNNLGEFALDGDPASGKSSGKIVGKIAPVGGVNAMTLTIPVRNGTIPDAGDPAGGELVLKNASDALTYRVQASDNLSSFELEVTEVTAPDDSIIQSGLSLPPLNTGWSYRTFRSPGAVLGDPSEFMRVQIE